MVSKGGKELTIASTVKRSKKIWPFVKSYSLTENLWVKNAGKNDQDFARYLLRIGDGLEKCNKKYGDDMVEIPKQVKSSASKLKEFCMEIFPGLKQKIQEGLARRDVSGDDWINWLMERAIICSKNDIVDKVNRILINEMPGNYCTLLCPH